MGFFPVYVREIQNGKKIRTSRVSFTINTTLPVFPGGIMRKALSLPAVLLTFSMSACSLAKPDGYDRVKNAKELYNTLSGARVVMEDISKGVTLMEFEFLINARGEMEFYYAGEGENGTEYAYSNGAEFYYKTADADGWSVIGPADEGYIYNIYNSEYRYPYADGSIFFLDGTSVEKSEITENPDGGVTVKYSYNADSLNSYAAGKLENVSSFSELEAVYSMDKDGYITEFAETGAVTDSEGVLRDVNIRIAVSDMNKVDKIPYPVDKLIDDEQ